MSSLSPVVAESGAQDSFAVSVVIPAHNALPMLLGAIESTLMQSLRPQEVVVVDDRSTDGTAEVVANHFAAFPEVRILRGHFGSAAAARNAGWRETHHPWVAFLDADDLWFPQKLMRAAAALRTFPVAGWFFSDGVFKPMGGEARSWLSSYADLPKSYVGHPTAQLLEVNFILTSSVVVRRGLLESLGGFDDSMSHAEDIDLWIRLARCSPATAVPEELVTYEHHPGGLTRNGRAGARTSRREVPDRRVAQGCRGGELDCGAGGRATALCVKGCRSRMAAGGIRSCPMRNSASSVQRTSRGQENFRFASSTGSQVKSSCSSLSTTAALSTNAANIATSVTVSFLCR